MSRSSRSAVNFLASSFGAVISVGVGFVVTPLLLRQLGPDRIGAFRVALDWFGYLGLLEFGVSAALTPMILAARSAGDGEQLSAVMAAGVRRYVRVAVATLVLGAGLVAILPQLTRTPEPLWGELRLGAAILLALLPVALLLGVYRPLADASQKSYLVSALLMLQGLAVAGIAVAAAFSGGGLAGQFLATAAGGLILPVGLALLLHRTVPFLSLLRPRPEVAGTARRLRELNRLTLTEAIISRICLLTDNIVVGIFFGPSAVASFFLTQRLIQVTGIQIQGLAGATWAGLVEIHQQGQVELFQQRLRELTKFTATLGGAFVVPLAVLTQPFVQLWVGAGQYAGDAVAGLAALNAIALPVFILWGWMFSGTGRVGRLIPYMVIQGILNLTLSLLATRMVGLPGPLIGTAIANLGYNAWWLPRLLKKDFGASPRRLGTAVAAPLLLSGVILFGLFAIREAWPGYTWARFAIEFGLASGGYLVLAWRLVLVEPERNLFRHLGNRWMRRFR